MKIFLHTLPKREIAEALSVGDIDVAVTLSPILAPTVRVETLYSAEIVAMLPHDDELTGEAAITPAMLVDRPLISYGSHAEFGAALDAAFATQDQVRTVSIQIASSVVALPLVRENLGIALVDGLSGWNPVAGVVTRPFLPKVPTPVSLSVNDARPQSRFLPVFVESLRSTFLAAEDSTAPQR